MKYNEFQQHCSATEESIWFDLISPAAAQLIPWPVLPCATVHYALGNVIIRNQKSPKVKHYYAFIFHRKSFKPFLNDAKLLKYFYKYLVEQIFWMFVYLFAKKHEGLVRKT